MKRSRAAAALAVCLVSVLPTAGCYQDEGETVSSQGPTGNGTDLSIGDDILIQDATLVADPAQGGAASLVMTILNEGEQPDSLVAVTTQPQTTSSQAAPVAVAPGAAIPVGGPAADQIVLTDLTVTPGSYATVTFSFQRAGSETRSLAVVPGDGYYEAYGPSASAAPAVPSAPAE